MHILLLLSNEETTECLSFCYILWGGFSTISIKLSGKDFLLSWQATQQIETRIEGWKKSELDPFLESQADHLVKTKIYRKEWWFDWQKVEFSHANEKISCCCWTRRPCLKVHGWTNWMELSQYGKDLERCHTQPCLDRQCPADNTPLAPTAKNSKSRLSVITIQS